MLNATSMSLTEEEKEKIRHEEIFRAEVRASIENDSPSLTKKKIWKFLNSPFALWLLSSIVVGLLTWGYSQWQASEIELAKRRETINRLDIEIVSRLRAAQAIIRTAQTKEQLYLAVIATNGGAEHVNFNFGVFPDLKNRTLRSLFYELKINLKDNAALKDVNTALNATNDLERMFIEGLNQLSLPQSSVAQIRTKEEVDSLQNLLNRFKVERWTW